MAFEKKTWTDRISEYPNRRLLTKEDGSTELVQVAREEGNISQEGDAFSARNMNDMENRVEQAFQVADTQIGMCIKVVSFDESTGTLVTTS